MLHMTGIVRPARPEEWESIEELIASASLPTDDLDLTAVSLFSVYDLEGEPAAVIALEPLNSHSAMLRSLVVSLKIRGQGIGNLLVETTEAKAKSKGEQNLYLLTNSAEQFFARCGYVQISRESAPDAVRSHAQFKHLCPSSAVLMHKALD